MAISNDNPSTALRPNLIGEKHTLNTLTLPLDNDCIENMHQSIELSIQLTKLDHSGDYYNAIKQELTHLLAEVGLLAVWAYQERLIHADVKGE